MLRLFSLIVGFSFSLISCRNDNEEMFLIKKDYFEANKIFFDTTIFYFTKLRPDIYRINQEHKRLIFFRLADTTNSRNDLIFESKQNYDTMPLYKYYTEMFENLNIHGISDISSYEEEKIVRFVFNYRGRCYEILYNSDEFKNREDTLYYINNKKKYYYYKLNDKWTLHNIKCF